MASHHVVHVYLCVFVLIDPSDGVPVISTDQSVIDNRPRPGSLMTPSIHWRLVSHYKNTMEHRSIEPGPECPSTDLGGVGLLLSERLERY